VHEAVTTSVLGRAFWVILLVSRRQNNAVRPWNHVITGNC